MKRKGYPSDLTDEQWEILVPLLPPPRRRGRPIQVPRREIVNALLYKRHTECSWRQLPQDFPKWQLVHYYSRRWSQDGTLQRIEEVLQTQVA